MLECGWRGCGTHSALVLWERVGLLLCSIFGLVISDLSIGTSGVTLLVYHPLIFKLGTIVVPLFVARGFLATAEEESRGPGCQCGISTM